MSTPNPSPESSRPPELSSASAPIIGAGIIGADILIDTDFGSRNEEAPVSGLDAALPPQVMTERMPTVMAIMDASAGDYASLCQALSIPGNAVTWNSLYQCCVQNRTIPPQLSEDCRGLAEGPVTQLVFERRFEVGNGCSRGSTHIILDSASRRRGTAQLELVKKFGTGESELPLIRAEWEDPLGFGRLPEPSLWWREMKYLLGSLPKQPCPSPGSLGLDDRTLQLGNKIRINHIPRRSGDLNIAADPYPSLRPEYIAYCTGTMQSTKGGRLEWLKSELAEAQGQPDAQDQIPHSAIGFSKSRQVILPSAPAGLSVGVGKQILLVYGPAVTPQTASEAFKILTAYRIYHSKYEYNLESARPLKLTFSDANPDDVSEVLRALGVDLGKTLIASAFNFLSHADDFDPAMLAGFKNRSSPLGVRFVRNRSLGVLNSQDVEAEQRLVEIRWEFKPGVEARLGLEYCIPAGEQKEPVILHFNLGRDEGYGAPKLPMSWETANRILDVLSYDPMRDDFQNCFEVGGDEYGMPTIELHAQLSMGLEIRPFSFPEHVADRFLSSAIEW